jgi:hypothetical protein
MPAHGPDEGESVHEEADGRGHNETPCGTMEPGNADAVRRAEMPKVKGFCTGQSKT